MPQLNVKLQFYVIYVSIYTTYCILWWMKPQILLHTIGHNSWHVWFILQPNAHVIVVALLETKYGDKYILVVIDHYSKQVEEKVVNNHGIAIKTY